MRLFIALLHLLLTCLYVRAADDDRSFAPIEMKQVEGYDDRPTWYMREAGENIGVPDRIPSYTDVLHVARRCLKWVLDQYPDEKEQNQKVRNRRGVALVAAMWDPTLETFYAATVPHDDLARKIAPASQDEAPYWYSATANVRGPDGKLLGNRKDADGNELPALTYHAEDLIFTNFEKDFHNFYEFGNSEYAKTERKEKKYPKGAIMAVWMSPSVKEQGGKGYWPCEDMCQVHAKALGVAWKPNNLPGKLSLDGDEITGTELKQFAAENIKNVNAYLKGCGLIDSSSNDDKNNPGQRLRMRDMHTAIAACRPKNGTSYSTGSSHATAEPPRYSNASTVDVGKSTTLSHVVSVTTHGHTVSSTTAHHG